MHQTYTKKYKRKQFWLNSRKCAQWRCRCFSGLQFAEVLFACMMQIGSTAWLIQLYLRFDSLCYHLQHLGGLDVLRDEERVSHRGDWVLKGKILNWAAGGTQKCQVWSCPSFAHFTAMTSSQQQKLPKGVFFKKQASNDNYLKKLKKQTSLLFEYQWSVWFWSQFCYFLQFRFNLSSLSVTPCAHLPFFCPSLHPQWFYFVCCWSMALHKLWEWYAYGSLTNKSVYRKHRLPSRQNIKMSVHS